MSPDITRVTVEAGSWVDVVEGREPIRIGEFDLGMIYDVPMPHHMELVSLLREEGFDPWQAAATTKTYFANASGETYDLVVSIYQAVSPVFASATAAVIAEQMIKAVWRWLPRKSREPHPSVTLSEASEAVQGYFLWRDGISPDDLEEISAQQTEDGFSFTVRNKRDDQLFAVRCAPGGHVVARISLTELERFRPLSVDPLGPR